MKTAFFTAISLFLIICAVIYFDIQNAQVTLRGNITKTLEGYVVFSTNALISTTGTSDMWVYEGTNGVWGFIFPKNFDTVTSLKGKYRRLVSREDYASLGKYQTEIPFHIPGSRFLWDPVKNTTISPGDKVQQCILVVDLTDDPDFR